MKIFPGIILGLFLLSPGCGTDAGNAGKPVVNDQTELASVVGMEHDEVMSSINDGSDKDTQALALTSATAEPTCVQNLDGSISITRVADLNSEFEYGRKAVRKVQTDALSTNLAMTLSVPGSLGILNCLNNNPLISWLQLAELKTESTWSKERKRTVVLKSDGTLINESTVQVSSKRSVIYEKIAADALNLTVRRTSEFDSTVTLSKKAIALNRKVQTLSGEPLVLEKSRKRGSGLTKVTIVSGAVQAIHTDTSKIILRYKNLELSLGSSCHPTSGSIDGQVFASSTATEATSSFTVKFDSDGATLVTADGEEDLELESCQL